MGPPDGSQLNQDITEGMGSCLIHFDTPWFGDYENVKVNVHVGMFDGFWEVECWDPCNRCSTWNTSAFFVQCCCHHIWVEEMKLFWECFRLTHPYWGMTSSFRSQCCQGSNVYAWWEWRACRNMVGRLVTHLWDWSRTRFKDLLSYQPESYRDAFKRALKT